LALVALVQAFASHLGGRAETTALLLLVGLPFLFPEATLFRRLAFPIAGTLGAFFTTGVRGWQWLSQPQPLRSAEGNLQQLLPPCGEVVAVLLSVAILAALGGAIFCTRLGGDRKLATRLIGFGNLFLLSVLVGLAHPHGEAGADWASVLPVFAATVGSAMEASPRALRGVLATALLSASVLGVRNRINEPPPDAPWKILEEAKVWAQPGGRLLLSGDDRHSILYYARRGHFPLTTILMIPEDMEETALLASLPQLLGTGGQIPRILSYPPLATPPLEFESVQVTPLRIEVLQVRKP
jgi:hypothetical protein